VNPTNVSISKEQENYVILLLYVDDMLVVGTTKKDIDDLKERLSKIFNMKDLVRQGKSLVWRS